MPHPATATEAPSPIKLNRKTPMQDTDTRLDTLARRRARAKLGWYGHAAIYAIVNAGLMTLSFSHGEDWAIYPALGWGLGLLMHGLSVWVFAPGGQLMERMVARERERLGADHGDRC